MTGPISSGSFDPLSAPGTTSSPSQPLGPSFTAGQFVRASMDNTAFFKQRPKGASDADKLLTRGTSMKVISSADTYVKVELDSGEVGYVPAVLLEDPATVTAAPSANPNEYQVYPPLEGFAAPVLPAEQPPEGAIPTVIDPEAPSTLEVPPPVEAPLEGAPKPSEPAPLPPNDEDLAAGKSTPEVTPKLEE